MGLIAVSRLPVSFVLASLVTAAACGGVVASAPVAHIVEIPAPEDDPPAAVAPEVHAAAACPPDTVAEKDHCVRVVASPEIPAWEAPRGHGDPCATWTSDKGLVDCDPKNEDPPADAGKARR